MIRSLALVVLFLGLCVGFVFPAHASENPSFDTAMANCSSGAATAASQGWNVDHPCAVGTNSYGTPAVCWSGLNPNGVRGTYCQVFTGDPPPDCPSGQVVPSGTPYNVSSATGEACTVSRCEMAFKVGGANSGGYVLTGSTCPAGTAIGPPKPTPTPPPQTSNPDGSTTYCDQISGTCVTSAPPTSAPPPSAGGDDPNSSTSGTSTTTNGASSSDTTTTNTSTTTTTTNTTTIGGGTSGGGAGDSTSTGTSTGTTTGTGTSHTSTPASSSSTSSQCTTGVCDVGNADGIMGGMYQQSTDTPTGVYNQFRSSVSASPLVSSVTGFFDMSAVSGGTCPVWQIPGNKYWGAAGFTFDFFCSPGMLALLALAGMLVLAVGAFSAFRIAIY